MGRGGTYPSVGSVPVLRPAAGAAAAAGVSDGRFSQLFRRFHCGVCGRLLEKVYLLITFFCVCCISWSGGLYLCYFLLPDRPMAVKYLVRTALHIVMALPILLAYRRYGRPLLREVSGFRKQSWKLLSAVSAIYFFCS